MRTSGKTRGPGLIHHGLLRLLRGQRGSLLVETVVALSVFGVLGTAVLSGVSTSYVSKRTFEVHSTAENILRNQMEYVFEQAYVPPPGTYLTVTPPATYSVTAQALVYDASSTQIETVRVTVSKEGQQVKVLDSLRSNR